MENKKSVELTETEMGAIFITIVNESVKISEDIKKINKKIDSLCFDDAMMLVTKRTVLENKRNLLLSSAEKFRQ